MRKYLLIIVILVIAIVGVLFAMFGMGFYIDFDPSARAAVPFRARGEKIERLTARGRYVPLTLRGVDISSAKAGVYATQFTADEDDYLRWLGQIGEMGADAVRVLSIMDADFYNAFYKYNTGRDNPLYLVQGVSVDDFANNNANDAYGRGFYDKLQRDLKSAVDIIHGRKAMLLLDTGINLYLRDISPWVVGYIVGSEWVADTIAYTNNNSLRAASFQGDYFSTAPGANRFEAMLASVMDNVTSYETKKYKTQRPVGFISDPQVDFLEYEDIYALQLLKFESIDAENIIPSEAMKAGTFAAYRLYFFCNDFSKYLSAPQRARLEPILSELDYNGIYEGYLELLARYHTMPVIAAGFGFSSSRGAVRMGVPPQNEREQGESLSGFSRELEGYGWAGGFISAWQDVWERRSWNTAFSQFVGRNHLWHDLQTDGQGYGLMAFDPVGEDSKRICVIDGHSDEWAEVGPVHERGGISIYARYDESALYLLLKGMEASPANTLYLPIDTLPDVGGYRCDDSNLTFDRHANFILRLSGEDGSALLVHERYNAMRQRFYYDVTGQDPYYNIPDIDSPLFETVQMVLANPLILDEITPETRVLLRREAWDTGVLIHGNGDPGSPSYNSLADFCYGDGQVEVRLPWTLLNFFDPSNMEVHGDYYENYGVEGVPVGQIYIGVAKPDESGIVEMSPISVQGWDTLVRTQERLKLSYYIIKEAWS